MVKCGNIGIMSPRRVEIESTEVEFEGWGGDAKEIKNKYSEKLNRGSSLLKRSVLERIPLLHNYLNTDAKIFSDQDIAKAVWAAYFDHNDKITIRPARENGTFVIIENYDSGKKTVVEMELDVVPETFGIRPGIGRKLKKMFTGE